jgi:hypothetical protein
MRKIAYTFLVACGVIVITYGIYFALGRPPIPLPSFHYTVSQGNRLYGIIKVTESERLTITWATNGEIEALADGANLAKISYDMDTLDNTTVLAAKYALPESNQSTLFKIVRSLQLPRTVFKIVGGFFYYIVRLKLTLNIYAG